jgi:hypothetical protein
MKANLLSLENREALTNYIYCLNSICIELEELLDSCLAGSDNKWRECRIKHLRSKFVHELEQAYNVDFLGVYTKYNKCYEDKVEQAGKTVTLN